MLLQAFVASVWTVALEVVAVSSVPTCLPCKSRKRVSPSPCQEDHEGAQYIMLFPGLASEQACLLMLKQETMWTPSVKGMDRQHLLKGRCWHGKRAAPSIVMSSLTYHPVFPVVTVRRFPQYCVQVRYKG